jgi:hypothetical protein
MYSVTKEQLQAMLAVIDRGHWNFTVGEMATMLMLRRDLHGMLTTPPWEAASSEDSSDGEAEATST